MKLSSSKGKQTFAAIDFESARLRDGGGDVPVQLGIACMNGGEIDASSFLGRDLRSSGPVLRGKGTFSRFEDSEEEDLLLLWPEIRNRLQGKAVVAHGIGTEKRFLLAFPGHGFGPWIDTLRLTRAVYPNLPSHSLGEICVLLKLEEEICSFELSGGWHNALYDAVAALVLLRHLMKVADVQDTELERMEKPELSAYFRARGRL